MNAILMSKSPKIWLNVMNEKATIILAKKFPKDYRGWVYGYCTKAKPFYILATFNRKKMLIQNTWNNLYKVNGKVPCRFWVDKVVTLDDEPNEFLDARKHSCLIPEEVRAYAHGSNLSAIHIAKLEVFDKPKELGNPEEPFYVWRKCDSCKRSGYETSACQYDEKCIVPCLLTKAPQSWCYIEVEDEHRMAVDETFKNLETISISDMEAIADTNKLADNLKTMERLKKESGEK